MSGSHQIVADSRCDPVDAEAIDLSNHKPMAAMTDAEFLSAFEECTLPEAEWTHVAHVRMGWLYLSTGDSFDSAMQKVRQGIRRFNVVALGKLSGYHETITYAFLRLINACLQQDDGLGSFEMFCHRHPGLLASNAVGTYFSKELLASRKARRQVVPADLSPLP